MEALDYLRFLLALLFVLGLIALVAWLARRLRIGAFAGGTAKARRLRVVEVLPLDARRRLVLVARDGVEHLLLLGQSEDRVVEAGIQAHPLQAGERAEARQSLERQP